MLTHHHLSSSLPPCLRSLSRPVASTSGAFHVRTLFISHPLRDGASPSAGKQMTKSESTTFKKFMNKIGHKFKYAKQSKYMNPRGISDLAEEQKHTLGANLPFWGNPSFKPPRPLSDHQKDIIFDMFLADPLANSPRKLAQRYNLSLKRVDAILRLKGLERDFSKGLPLQTGFQIGMDKLLNAFTHPVLLSREKDQHLHTPLHLRDVSEVDTLEQEEKRDAVRYRYERLYWESTPEDGREPILPGVLMSSKERVLQREKSKREAAARMLQGRLPKNAWIIRPPRSSFVAWRLGRVPTRFVDVGAEFVTFEDLVKHKAAQKLKRKERRMRIVEKKTMLQQLKSTSKQ